MVATSEITLFFVFNKLFQLAQLVTFYNYTVPLLGLSSIQAPNGTFTYFDYDIFGRLKTIKDHNSKVLKEFAYNYTNGSVTEWTPRVALNSVSVNTATFDALKMISYVDGLGRNLQKIIVKASPDSTKDIVASSVLYDAFGRGYKSFLPSPSPSVGGVLVSTSALQTAAQNFYSDTNPFTETTVFDNSPLNRPLTNFGAGQAWRTANKSVGMQYKVAPGNIIKRFKASAGAVFCNVEGQPNTIDYYGANELQQKITTTERGKTVTEYTDLQGRVVQKEVEVSADTVLTTAYCYDLYDRLAYVLPPNAYKLFTSARAFILDSENDSKEGIYIYKYDRKGQQIQKRIPGHSDFEVMVYDRLYRLVMNRDAQDDAQGHWHFRKHDPLNRSVMSGLIFLPTGYSRETIQNEFDSHTITSEARNPNFGLFRYLNNSFPVNYNPNSDTTYNATAGTGRNLKTITYYDDHNFLPSSFYNFDATNAYETQWTSSPNSKKGLVTGSVVRNLENNTWYRNVNYYDFKGRMIQGFAQNHLGGIDRMESKYSFVGEVLKMRMTHKKPSVADIVEISEYDYDHLGRKTKFKHSLGGIQKTIASYYYDATGRMIQKQYSPSSAIGSSQTGNWTNNTTWQGGSLPTISDRVTINTGHIVTIPSGQTVSAGTLFDKGILQNFGTLQMGTLAGNTSSSTLQTLDYQHHIRFGWRGINLDAAGNLTNKLFSMKLGFEETGYYDGNIGKQEWKSIVDGLTRSYSYRYDKSSRILGASYLGGKPNENYSLENMSYDANGNILSLNRKGKTGVNSWGNIDQLSYVYEANSNKIKKVSDLQGLSNQNVGDFRDSSNVAIEYEYWQDGSLKIDRNKKISQVDYNYLKLPKQITFEGGQWIKNQYDVSGKKLKSTTSDGIIYDYVGNKIYKNGILYQISHDEGRVVNGSYEYDIKDHLGNLRVSFRDSSGVAKIVSKSDYDPWGLTLKGLDYSNPTFNKNNFQFGSKEKIETFGLNWIDFGARQYMPDVPHFTSIDPAGEFYNHESSYCYAGNNPLSNIDVGGAFKIDANFARKYPTAAKLIAYYLPQLVNNGKVISYFMKQYNLSRKQVIENFTYGSGPTINATVVPAWFDDASLPMFDPNAGRYDAIKGEGKYKNNLYIGHFELEALEKSFKSKNANSLGINMFKVSSLIVHEYAHYLNFTYNTANALVAEASGEQGEYSEKEIYGQQLSNPRSGGTLDYKGYYNKNKSSRIMVGMSLSMQDYFNNYFLSKSVELPVEDSKKKDPSGSKVSGGND